MTIETLLVVALVLLVLILLGVIAVYWKQDQKLPDSIVNELNNVKLHVTNTEQNVKSHVDGAVSNLVGFFGNLMGKQTAAIPTAIATAPAAPVAVPPAPETPVVLPEGVSIIPPPNPSA